jgi:hypothetical protein
VTATLKWPGRFEHGHHINTSEQELARECVAEPAKVDTALDVDLVLQGGRG